MSELLDVTCKEHPRARVATARQLVQAEHAMTSGDATSNRHPETGEPSEGSRRPIYKTETTGNYWQDVWTAFKVRALP